MPIYAFDSSSKTSTKTRLPNPTTWTLTAIPGAGPTVTAALDANGLAEIPLVSGQIYALSITNGSVTFQLGAVQAQTL